MFMLFMDKPQMLPKPISPLVGVVVVVSQPWQMAGVVVESGCLLPTPLHPQQQTGHGMQQGPPSNSQVRCRLTPPKPQKMMHLFAASW